MRNSLRPVCPISWTSSVQTACVMKSLKMCIRDRYTPKSNTAYTGSSKYADYNYLEKTTSYVAGDNTFWIPFPPGEDTEKLPGGKNYTVVLRAVDENGNVLNTKDADRQETFEFISDGIAVSKSASYAITSTGRASVDSSNKNVLNLTLLASDPLYQIVDDKYSLFVKPVSYTHLLLFRTRDRFW